MPKKQECVVVGCKNERYKDTFFCEEHWKSRREKPDYKDKDYGVRKK